MLDMHTRPSEIMGIEDAYTAFCFDEVCAYIITELRDGKEPVIKTGIGLDGKEKHYSKPSDIYNKFKNK